MPTPVAKTPRELRVRITKRSPKPHAAYIRGRLAAAGLLAQADVARYLASLDERSHVAFALGVSEDPTSTILNASEVELRVISTHSGRAAS